MTIVAIVVGIMLGASALLTALRIVRGPSVLDRLVGMDMLLAIILCGLAAMIMVSQRSALVPVLVIASLLAFTGSVSVVRFIGGDPQAEAGKK
jgi:multicomponent Na+:H+ antiporter subunit F